MTFAMADMKFTMGDMTIHNDVNYFRRIQVVGKKKTYHEDSVQETAEYPAKSKALSSKLKVATWCKIIQVCQEYYEMYAINVLCQELTILDKI